MVDLPLMTHKYLIEPISQTRHLKRLLIKRFVSFILQIRKSSKRAPNQLLNVLYFDTRSVTGNNIREILKLTNKWRIEEVRSRDVDEISYQLIPDEEKWRIGVINDLFKVSNDEMEIRNFSKHEVKSMLEFACIS